MRRIWFYGAGTPFRDQELVVCTPARTWYASPFKQLQNRTCEWFRVHDRLPVNNPFFGETDLAGTQFFLCMIPFPDLLFRRDQPLSLQALHLHRAVLGLKQKTRVARSFAMSTQDEQFLWKRCKPTWSTTKNFPLRLPEVFKNQTCAWSEFRWSSRETKYVFRITTCQDALLLQDSDR